MEMVIRPLPPSPPLAHKPRSLPEEMKLNNVSSNKTEEKLAQALTAPVDGTLGKDRDTVPAASVNPGKLRYCLEARMAPQPQSGTVPGGDFRPGPKI